MSNDLPSLFDVGGSCSMSSNRSCVLIHNPRFGTAVVNEGCLKEQVLRLTYAPTRLSRRCALVAAPQCIPAAQLDRVCVGALMRPHCLQHHHYISSAFHAPSNTPILHQPGSYSG